MEKILRWMAFHGCQLTPTTREDGGVLIQLDTIQDGHLLLRSSTILSVQDARRGHISWGSLGFTDAVERLVEKQEAFLKDKRRKHPNA